MRRPCTHCGTVYQFGTCESTESRRIRCMETEPTFAKGRAIQAVETLPWADPPDRTYLDLRGARERLCRAQTHVPAHWRSDLETAIRIIDEVGSSVCPEQWSRFDQPEVQ